jgi:DNA-binding NtrC family response regulator
MLAVDVVEEAGFHVIEAANADEAVRILECTSNIALVFTDVDMPGTIDGLRFAAVVHDRWPPVQIIVTSGLTNIDMATLPMGAVFFSKPYDTRKLVKRMHLMAA